MKIILASTSPRRKFLLKQAGVEFEVIEPIYDEKFDTDNFSFEKIERISYNKALSIAHSVPKNSVILSADTVVVYDNKILLKPKNKEEAFKMLKTLSGKQHFVVTSYTLLLSQTEKFLTKHVKTYVKFANLSDKQILKYINEFNPLDKAGAYGLQELPDYFQAQTIGSDNNVIGLPVEEILEDLKKF